MASGAVLVLTAAEFPAGCGRLSRSVGRCLLGVARSGRRRRFLYGWGSLGPLAGACWASWRGAGVVGAFCTAVAAGRGPSGRRLFPPFSRRVQVGAAVPAGRSPARSAPLLALPILSLLAAASGPVGVVGGGVVSGGGCRVFWLAVAGPLGLLAGACLWRVCGVSGGVGPPSGWSFGAQ